MSAGKLVPDADVELAMRRLADIAADAAFLAALLARYPAAASLDKLGLRPVDQRYRAALGAAVEREARP